MKQPRVSDRPRAAASTGLTRRAFVIGLGAAGVGGAFGAWIGAEEASATPTLRPPGAQRDPEAFLARCIGCRRCAQVCPNQCIQFVGVEGGLRQWGTPFITPRARSCTLCMACTQACPTGALEPIKADPASISAQVRMGVAWVDEHICLSFKGFSCGTCVRACPFEGVALRAGFFERPEVDQARCVGCGACERACIQTPQAIRVRPASS